MLKLWNLQQKKWDHSTEGAVRTQWAAAYKITKHNARAEHNTGCKTSPHLLSRSRAAFKPCILWRSLAFALFRRGSCCRLLPRLSMSDRCPLHSISAMRLYLWYWRGYVTRCGHTSRHGHRSLVQQPLATSGCEQPAATPVIWFWFTA
jgi:hypothetical protein